MPVGGTENIITIVTVLMSGSGVVQWCLKNVQPQTHGKLMLWELALAGWLAKDEC